MKEKGERKSWGEGGLFDIALVVCALLQSQQKITDGITENTVVEFLIGDVG